MPPPRCPATFDGDDQRFRSRGNSRRESKARRAPAAPRIRDFLVSRARPHKGSACSLAQPRRLFYVKRIPAASAKSGATAGEKTIVRLPRTGSDSVELAALPFEERKVFPSARGAMYTAVSGKTTGKQPIVAPSRQVQAQNNRDLFFHAKGKSISAARRY